MLRVSRRCALVTFALVQALGLRALAEGAARPADPLAKELARWTSFLRDQPASDPLWAELKPAVEPMLAGANQALQDGRRWLALLRLDAAQQELAAAAYASERPPAEHKQLAAFEAEWRRMAGVLAADLAAPDPARFADLRPAALRALAEAARAQVRVYYDASLEYGRSTEPESGLFYLGEAHARGQFAAFCRSLHEAAAPAGAAPRSLRAELDALEGELLDEYKPPASLERHTEFIVASAALKTARELDTAGLRHGALLRYLQAAQRVALLRSAAPRPQPAETATRLRELELRLAQTGEDHSIGRVFLEAGQADLVAARPTGAAAQIARDVLPRYFAALEAAPAPKPQPEPGATVTLVRWPYT